MLKKKQQKRKLQNSFSCSPTLQILEVGDLGKIFKTMDIIADIKNKRKELGESQREFATRFGVTEHSYKRWVSEDGTKSQMKCLPRDLINFVHVCHPQVTEVKVDKKHRKEVYMKGYMDGIAAASIEQKIGAYIREMIIKELHNRGRRKREIGEQETET